MQEPVAPHIIAKGISTPGLLAQVLVAKYADHLPLHRQEAIFARAGFAIPRSTLAQWVGTCGVRLQPLVERDFIYIAKDDEYQCPAGQRAVYRYTREENGLEIHRYLSSACPVSQELEEHLF